MRSNIPSGTKTFFPDAASRHSLGIGTAPSDLGPLPPAIFQRSAKAIGPLCATQGEMASSFFRRTTKVLSALVRLEEISQTLTFLPGLTPTTTSSVSGVFSEPKKVLPSA